MKRLYTFCYPFRLFLVVLSCLPRALSASGQLPPSRAMVVGDLELVAPLAGDQPAGVAISGSGRLFVTYPLNALELSADKKTVYFSAFTGHRLYAVDANVPTGTVTFALVVRDPDTAISGSLHEIVHWIIFNIPPATRELPEGVPGEAQLANGSIQALNHNNKTGYMGMAAEATGPYHHYTFELFALDTKLRLGPDATQTDLFSEMDGHILMKGVLVGRFHLP